MLKAVRKIPIKIRVILVAEDASSCDNPCFVHKSKINCPPRQIEPPTKNAFNTLKASQASGGKYLGDFKTNHCASYELEIEKAGNYEVLVSVGTINKGGIVMVNCNGSFSEEATVPNTGAWQTYQNVALKVWMETGTQILTISNLNGTWNFD